MQKRLSVARALLVSPQVLLVDEATHDLAVNGARRIRALVRGIADDGAVDDTEAGRGPGLRGFGHAPASGRRRLHRLSG